ncbi:MAG TPA: hypothetical protein DDX85_04575, partial [Nitrospiraceae bacterium]|nr:hypothetical protein [Nitrospiraceae bacterium]
IDINDDEMIHHLRTLDSRAHEDLQKKGYLVADMKPEHIIISEPDAAGIVRLGNNGKRDSFREQVALMYRLIQEGRYSVIDYELLLRTPEHDAAVKSSRRYSYLDDQRHRFDPSPLPAHLTSMEIFGVPYLFGHAESTGGRLWVVGRNPHLFDYFLPERWRKTPSIRLSDTKEVFYTITKDNIHLVWETSMVGEMPDEEEARYNSRICEFGINSPFEEFAIAHHLNKLGIPCVYVRAIYMTGTAKIEASTDLRRYESHKYLLDPEGNPILQESHNYITIRGYYNGPDQWVAQQTGPLYAPVDLARAVLRGLIDESQCRMLFRQVKENLKDVNYDGSLLKLNDLLLAVNGNGDIVRDTSGSPLVVICNFEHIWNCSDVPMVN